MEKEIQYLTELADAQGTEPPDQYQLRLIISRIEKMRDGLEQLADCKFTNANCASLDVASKRVRSIARKALGK